MWVFLERLSPQRHILQRHAAVRVTEVCGQYNGRHLLHAEGSSQITACGKWDLYSERWVTLLSDCLAETLILWGKKIMKKKRLQQIYFGKKKLKSHTWTRLDWCCILFVLCFISKETPVEVRWFYWSNKGRINVEVKNPVCRCVCNFKFNSVCINFFNVNLFCSCPHLRA